MTTPLTHSLLVSVLLTATLSCSKKAVPPAEEKNIARYTLDGRVITCQVARTVLTPGHNDYLTLNLTTVPQPSSGPETLVLNLWKSAGQPDTTYNFMFITGGMVYNATSKSSSFYYDHNATARTFTSAGDISGTFGGESHIPTGPGTYTVDHTITAGSFTNVQL